MSEYIFNIISENKYYDVKNKFNKFGKYFEKYDKCCKNKKNTFEKCYKIHYEKFLNCIN